METINLTQRQWDDLPDYYHSCFWDKPPDYKVRCNRGRDEVIIKPDIFPYHPITFKLNIVHPHDIDIEEVEQIIPNKYDIELSEV